MMIVYPFVPFGLISAGLFMLASIPVELGLVPARSIDLAAVIDLRFWVLIGCFQNGKPLLFAEVAVSCPETFDAHEGVSFPHYFECVLDVPLNFEFDSSVDEEGDEGG